MGRPIEYARMAVAIVENPMLNGSTIRLVAGSGSRRNSQLRPFPE